MADAVRISQLPALSEVRDNDITVVVDEAITQTSKVTVSQIRDHAPKVGSVSDEHVINGHLPSSKLGLSARNKFPVALSNASAINDNTVGENTTRYQAADATITDFGLLWLAFESALEAGTYLGAVFSSPTGMIGHFAMEDPPDGWLACDGSTVSRTTYSALFAAIGTNWGAGDGATTFAIPDLRGEFLRTLDNGRGIDTDRIFASSQEQQISTHKHSYPFLTGDINFYRPNSFVNFAISGYPPNYANNNYSQAVSNFGYTKRYWHGKQRYYAQFGNDQESNPNHFNDYFVPCQATSAPDYVGVAEPTGDTGSRESWNTGHGLENRPRNVAVLTCIKY